MSNYQKKSGFAGKAIISVLLAGLLAAGVCCTGYASRNDAGEWFKNGDLSSWHWSDKSPDENPDDSKPNPDDPTPSITDDGAAELENGDSNGISLLNAKIPRAAYAANGISAYADTAFTLTATVTPDEAINKAVDWSVAFENPESEWASGKTAVDYVKVTPVSDGALTATATCMQAFGERIIITAQIRDGSDDLKATCIANYVEKFLGRDFKIFSHSDDQPSRDYGWNFNLNNLNPVIDIPQTTSLWAWLQYSLKDCTTVTTDGYYSSVFTKSNRAFTGIAYISATEEYLAAVRAAGFTPKVSAGEYFVLNDDTAFTDIFFPTATQGQAPTTAQAWTAYRNTLKQNVDKVMFRVKCSTPFSMDDIRDTIYNVKISASSLETLAEDIKLNYGEIDF